MNDDLSYHILAHAIRDGSRVRHALLERCAAQILAAAKLVTSALEQGNKVLFCGNGGSAADAQHIAAELVGRYVAERAALPGIALTVDTSALTAIANDYGFDAVFERQLRGLGKPGDVLVALTTSGRSPNVVRAVTAAREMGIRVIGMTGAKGADFASSCDACVVVPSTNTARIQELHITVGHVLCELVDAAMLSKGDKPTAQPRPKHVSASLKEVDLPTLVRLSEGWRAAGRIIVWTNGVFDVLHSGHLASLMAARAFGDVLIVGVNADETVRKSKGPDRPVFPAADRVAMLGALEAVDHVLVFDEPTPAEVLAAIKPHVHCKGADYAPPDGKPIPEADIVKSYGGRIEFLPMVPERSTTSTVARILGA